MAVPAIIKTLANKVRKEIYGKDVRESIAQSMEVSGETADDAQKRSIEQLNRVDRLIRENPQPSEVVDARGDYPILRDRLNSTDSQLAQITRDKADISYVDNIISQLSFGASVFETLAELQEAHPNGDDNIYIVVEDGSWYYWNDLNWVVGGEFMSAPINDEIKRVVANFLQMPTMTNIIKNGNFTNLNNWSIGLGEAVTQDNILKLSSSGLNPNISNNSGFRFVPGNLVFLSVLVKVPSNVNQIELRFRDADTNTNVEADVVANPEQGKWIRLYGILEIPKEVSASSYFQAVARLDELRSVDIEFKEFLGIDLTNDFGRNNEPDLNEIIDIVSNYPDNFFVDLVSRLNFKQLSNELLNNKNDVEDLKGDRDFVAYNLVTNGDYSLPNSEVEGLAKEFSYLNGSRDDITVELDRSFYKINGQSQKLTLTNKTSAPFAFFGQNIDMRAGHKYYIGSWVACSLPSITNMGYRVYSGSTTKYTGGKNTFSPAEWARLFYIYEADGSETDIAFFASNTVNSHEEVSVWFDGLVVIDLTEIFGKSKEPRADETEHLLSYQNQYFFDRSRQLVTNKYLYENSGEIINPTSNKYEIPKIIIDEAIGCWWTYPRAIRHNDKIYTTYTKNSGGIYITSYDYNTGEQQESLLADFSSSDDHNQASISILPDSRIMCIYARHVSTYNKLSLKITDLPEDITTFGDEIAVLQPGENQSQDYVQTFYVAGKYVSFYRWYARRRNESDGYYCAWSFRTSLDGVNWSAHQYHLIGGGQMQYYTLFAQKDADTLKFYGYTNPSQNADEKKIRYGEVNFDTGEVSTLELDENDNPTGLKVIGNLSELIDDSLIERNGRREPTYTFEKELFNPIYQSNPETQNNRLLDATRQYPDYTDNRLLICEWNQSDQGYNAEYKSILLNDDYTRVIESGLPNTGKAAIPLTEPQTSYYAGAVFEDGNSKIIYLAREDEGLWYVEKWSYQNGEWVLVRIEDISKEQLFRPLNVLNDSGVTLWCKGEYLNLGSHDTVMTNIPRG